MKERKYYLDNICCLLILHMIYTVHIADHCGDYLPDIIKYIKTTLSFFMSWFFFKGGMMHKDSSIKSTINKSAQRLLVPYLVFFVIGFFLDGIISYTLHCSEFTVTSLLKHEALSFLTSSVLTSTAAAWFLLALFVAKISFTVLSRHFHPLSITIVFVIAAYAINIMNSHGWGLDIHISNSQTHIVLPTYYIGTMCHGLSLYSLGYLIKEKQFNSIVFGLSAILFILKYFIWAGIGFKSNDFSGANYLLAVLYNISGCVVINNIFKKFFDKKIPFISYIGSNSMVYYLIHYPVLYTAAALFMEAVSDTGFWTMFLYLSFIVTVSLILANYVFKIKKLRFIVGG